MTRSICVVKTLPCSTHVCRFFRAAWQCALLASTGVLTQLPPAWLQVTPLSLLFPNVDLTVSTRLIHLWTGCNHARLPTV